MDAPDSVHLSARHPAPAPAPIPSTFYDRPPLLSPILSEWSSIPRPPLFPNPILPLPPQNTFPDQTTPARIPPPHKTPRFPHDFRDFSPHNPLAQTLRKPCAEPHPGPCQRFRRPTLPPPLPPFPNNLSCRFSSPSRNKNGEPGKLRPFGESVSPGSCLSWSRFSAVPPRAFTHTPRPRFYPTSPPDFPPDTPRFSPPTPPDFPHSTPCADPAQTLRQPRATLCQTPRPTPSAPPRFDAFSEPVLPTPGPGRYSGGLSPGGL